MLITQALINENLDPEFGLQPHPVVDVLFFKLPQTAKDAGAFFEIANQLPGIHTLLL